MCVANLHATAEGDHTRAAHELLRVGASCASSGIRDAPLVVGGDMNLRPREHPWAFDELRERFGLAPPTADDAVDHLLARGLEVVDAAAASAGRGARGRARRRRARAPVRSRRRRSALRACHSPARTC